MSNEHKPLTLERWAALDQAASPGPWVAAYSNDTGPDDDYFEQFYEIRCDGEEIARTRTYDDRFVFGGERGKAEGLACKQDAEFMAASRQAPTRLLAALRALPTYEAVIRDYGDLEEVVSLSELRALIEQTDLAAPEQPQ